MRIEVGSDRLRVEIEGPIGWIVFDHPERLNALSLDMQEALPVALDALERDDRVRVVVMRGAGERAFISGADLSEFPSRRGEAAAVARRAPGDGRALVHLDKPLLAMIHGYCIGGGVATALAADIRLASDDAQFAIPAARLGVGYPFEGVRALVDLVGPAWANEIFFSARRLDAAEALRIGLVNRIVPGAALESETRALAEQIAENAPLSIRAARAAVREAMRDRAERDVQRVNELVTACFESDDHREGVAAFFEKRAPRFRGR